MGYSDMIKGALLHDIGEFVMRGKNNRKSMTHQKFGYEWLSMHNIPDSISELAACYHRVDQNNSKHELMDAFEPQVNEILIVYEADNLSSGKRPDKKTKSGQWQADAPLMSAFSKLSLSHKQGNPAYNNR